MSGWWTAAFVAQWVLLVVLCVVVVALARQVGTLHLRLGPRGALEIDDGGPALGEALPPVDARGRRRRPAHARRSRARRLVLFSSPTCMVCREVAPALPAAARSGGTRRRRCVHDPDAERAFEVPGTPFLLVLDELGHRPGEGHREQPRAGRGAGRHGGRRMREETAWAS